MGHEKWGETQPQMAEAFMRRSSSTYELSDHADKVVDNIEESRIVFVVDMVGVP